MKNAIHQFARQLADTLRRTGRDLRTIGERLWQAHLARLETSPVYETLLLALIDLALGQKFDLHQLLTRLLARLHRNSPEIPEDGWAY